MINLLSYESIKQIRAARLNVILFRYIIILGFSTAFLILACMTTYLFINSNDGSVSLTNIGDTYSSLEKQVETMRNNFQTSKSILDQQVSYSDVLSGIAPNLPTGTILKSIKLSESSFGSETSIQIGAVSADLETKIKDNFQKSSSMFSSYKYESTTPNTDSSSDYNFTINATIIINKAAFQ